MESKHISMRMVGNELSGQGAQITLAMGVY